MTLRLSRAPNLIRQLSRFSVRDYNSPGLVPQSTAFDGKEKDGWPFYALPFDGSTKVSDRVRASPAGDAKKEVAMRQRLTWLVLFSAAILITASFYAANVWATQASGFKKIGRAHV